MAIIIETLWVRLNKRFDNPRSFNWAGDGYATLTLTDKSIIFDYTYRYTLLFFLKRHQTKLAYSDIDSYYLAFHNNYLYIDHHSKQCPKIVRIDAVPGKVSPTRYKFNMNSDIKGNAKDDFQTVVNVLESHHIPQRKKALNDTKLLRILLAVLVPMIIAITIFIALIFSGVLKITA